MTPAKNYFSLKAGVFFYLPVMQIALFEELLAKEMTRKEFLLHLGLLLLTITGITGLLRTVSNPNLLSKHKSVASGFGSGPYGGGEKS